MSDMPVAEFQLPFSIPCSDYKDIGVGAWYYHDAIYTVVISGLPIDFNIGMIPRRSKDGEPDSTFIGYRLCFGNLPSSIKAISIKRTNLVACFEGSGKVEVFEVKDEKTNEHERSGYFTWAVAVPNLSTTPNPEWVLKGSVSLAILDDPFDQLPEPPSPVSKDVLASPLTNTTLKNMVQCKQTEARLESGLEIRCSGDQSLVVPVTKSTLIDFSPYFAKVFQEQIDGSTTEEYMNLEAYPVTVVETLIKGLFLGQFTDIDTYAKNSRDLDKLALLVEEVQPKQLDVFRNQIEQVLIKKIYPGATADDLIQCLSLAEVHNFTALDCLSIAALADATDVADLVSPGALTRDQTSRLIRLLQQKAHVIRL